MFNVNLGIQSKADDLGVGKACRLLCRVKAATVVAFVGMLCTILLFRENFSSNKCKCSRNRGSRKLCFPLSKDFHVTFLFPPPFSENPKRSISVRIKNSSLWICSERKPFRHGAWSRKFFNISFTTHWGGRPQQQSSDLLTTITMFDQIKAEPLHFYQSSCPTQITAQINPQQQHQVTAVLQQSQIQNQQNATVVTINDDKDNLQVSNESVVEWIYPEIAFSSTPIR